MSRLDHLKKLIGQHKQNLEELEKQKATFGQQVPIHILTAMKHEEEEIKRVEKELNENYYGSQIIDLLTKLDISDTEEWIENVQDRYEMAKEEMTTAASEAIKRCEQVLEWLEDSIEFNAPYARAKFYMLLGAIYLNTEKKRLKLAVDYFRESRDQFRKRQSHLEGVAELGLAVAQYEMGNFEAAIGSLERAKQIAYRESITYHVDNMALDDLRLAIKEQNSKTLEKIQAKESGSKTQIDETEKLLPIFTISAGERCIGLGGTIDLNLLSLEDYRRSNLQSSENVIVDSKKRRGFRRADYILEIDGEVNRVNDGLSLGDWLLIESKENPKELRGKLVAVLQRHVSDAGVETSASLKTFSHAGDHYFLNALGKSKSILITHYQSGDAAKISAYYQGHAEIEVTLAFDVRVSGEVIDRIPSRSAEKIKPDYIWEVPIIGEFPDNPDSQIDEEDVIEIIQVRKRERKKGHDYFGLKEEIERNDDNGVKRYVIICQQPKVEDKDIAAVMIEMPGTQEKLKEFRLFRLYDQYDDKRHLYLQAVKRLGKDLVVDPSGEHLIAIEEGADINAVKNLYAKYMAKLKLKFYEQAIVTVVGKYVETVEVKKD